jgi:hypothetical protein
LQAAFQECRDHGAHARALALEVERQNCNKDSDKKQANITANTTRIMFKHFFLKASHKANALNEKE